VSKRKREPKPKFKVGDVVKRDDGSMGGVVWSIYGYEEITHGYLYKVREDNGSLIYWNEGSMRLVRRPRKRRS
jgi:hypothetical protein